MSHNHSHNREGTSEKNLFITMTMNFLITMAESSGCLISGGLSLISDALHHSSNGMQLSLFISPCG